MHRFMQGDEVSYVGTRYAERLAGKLGYVYAHVKGTEHGVVVDFPTDKGVDSFIMDEVRHLVPYNPALKPREKSENRKVKVEHRRKHDQFVKEKIAEEDTELD